MSGNQSGLLGMGSPLRVVRLTSGTGTFVPLVDNSRCLARVQGAGAGGSQAGGGAGCMQEYFLLIPIAGAAYIVGAASVGVINNTAAANGANSVFAERTAEGGRGASSGSIGVGGKNGNYPGGDGGSTSLSAINGFCGFPGGGRSGGGGSFFGAGGSSGTPGDAASGYGAGGGGAPGVVGGVGGNGSGGYIEIWEYGA